MIARRTFADAPGAPGAAGAALTGPGARDRRAERLLGATGLFERVDGFRGELRVAGLAARVDVETPECVRLTHALVETPMDSSADALCGVEALERTARLDGNARLALVAPRPGEAREHLVLVADTVLGDGVHLASVLRGGLESFARDCASSEGPPLEPVRAQTVPALDEDRVLEGLRETGLAEDGVVRREDGWELRPRLRGAVRAVRLAVRGRELHLTRVVLKRAALLGSESGSELLHVAADVALRLNAVTRHARLALVGHGGHGGHAGGALVAEARLTEPEVRGARIADAARAVAAAAELARSPLELLLANPGVAEGYAELFLSSRPRSARRASQPC